MAESVSKTFSAFETWDYSSAAKSNYTKRITGSTKVTQSSGNVYYIITTEISAVNSTGSRVISLDLSELPKNAVVDSVNIELQYTRSDTSDSTCWNSFPDIPASSESTSERLKNYLNQNHPDTLRITAYVSGVLGKTGSTTSQNPDEVGRTYSSQSVLFAVKVDLMVNYTIPDDDGTVHYGTGGQYKLCTVRFAVNGVWKKCKAFFGTGGSWKQIK